MKIILIFAAVFVAGVIIGISGGQNIIRRQRRLIRDLRASRQTADADTNKTETMKKVIWVCLINGFAWVWCSYILAWMDKTQIAESLSQVAVTEIIGVVLAYAVKSAVENLSKNNHWPDKVTSSDRDKATGPEPERTEPPDVGL